MLQLIYLSLLLVAATAAPTRCGNTQLSGYVDLESLQADIDGLTSESDTTIFTICPGTTIDLEKLSEGLRINVDESLAPITIQCGEASSEFVNECVFVGGMHHIWVTQVGALTVSRMTFRKATRGSVWTGLGSKHISFQDCTWEDNVYDWDNTGGANCPTGCAGAVSGKDGGSVFFGDCMFIHNEGESGAVYGNRMDYSFNGCKFEGNVGTATNIEDDNPPSGSAITLHNPASELSLYRNCFIDNRAQGPATILIEDASMVSRNSFATLQLNIDNNFDGNRVSQSNEDSSVQWCHNSIYNYVEGRTDFTIDDCISGTATCCQCKSGAEDEQDSNRDIDQENDEEGEEQVVEDDSRSSATSLSLAGIMALAGVMVRI